MSSWIDVQKAFQMVLRGVLDPGSPLHVLDKFALNEICNHMRTLFVESMSIETHDKFFIPIVPIPIVKNNTWITVDVSKLFPPPTGINVNMMPFDPYNLEGTLPETLHGYIDLIRQCRTPNIAPIRRCRYITVHESFVRKGDCQRRPGLHIERPHEGCGKVVKLDKTKRLCDAENREYAAVSWGGGYHDKDRDIPVDGIYMASTVPGSCRVYQVAIGDPKLATDAHGGIEHLRDRIGPSFDVEGLVWFTDRTPHESLPAKEDGYRQFIRIVVGPVSVWRALHNTANPNPKIVPDAQISYDDKFL
jgi:hypothetical protein